MISPASPFPPDLPRQAQWRYWVRHPGQFLLSWLIIAVGVASAVGMDVAIEASQKSFLLSLAASNGRATHRIEANGGIPDGFVGELRIRHKFHEACPVVIGRLHLKHGDQDEGVQLLGLDPLIDSLHLGPELSLPNPTAQIVGGSPQTTDNQMGSMESLLQPGSVAMSRGLAAKLGLQPGQNADCLEGQKLRLATLFEAPLPRDSIDNIVLCDIATAQELLGLQGRVSYVALRAPEGAALADWEKRLHQAVPEPFHIHSVGSRSYASLQLASSLFLNLRALSWMAALVGIFLIYQAQSFCLLATRPQLAQLRRLGLTPGEAAWIVAQDGLLLGWLGSLLGCLGGMGLAKLLIGMLTASLDDHYFSVQVQQLEVQAASLIKGGCIGLGTALLAILPHAWAVYRDPPALLGLNSRLEGDTQAALRHFFWGGVAMTAVAGLGLSCPLPLPWHLLSLGGLLIGLAALIPHSVGRLNSGLCRALSRAFPRLPVWFSLGLRQVHSNMSRTGVAVAALSLALACVVSIETMVGSFRQTLDAWLEQMLQADVYVSLADHDSMRDGSYIPREFLERLHSQSLILGQGHSVAEGQGPWKGVSALVVRHLLVQFDFPVPPRGARPPQLLIALPGTEAQLDRYRLVAQSEDARSDFRRGQAWITQPFARRYGIQVGDSLSLATPSGRQRLSVSGIFVDFSTDQGYVLVDYAYFLRWFGDTHVTAIALKTESAALIPHVLERLKAAPGADLLDIRSNASLKQLSRTIFERTFQVTRALRWLALTLAVVGMTSALTLLSLQKRRERALLRALGMTRQEVGLIHLVQSLALGFWAGLFAIGTGLAQAYAMVTVIQSSAFGWTLAYHVPASAWASPWAAALCCCLAGLLSLSSESGTEIASFLREE